MPVTGGAFHPNRENTRLLEFVDNAGLQSVTRRNIKEEDVVDFAIKKST